MQYLKRFFIFVLLMTLFIPSVAIAQNDEWTTYEANGLTFSYPADWIIDESNGLSVRNTEERFFGLNTETLPTEDYISISFLTPQASDEDDIIPKSGNIDFLHGYYSGLLYLVSNMSINDSQPESPSELIQIQTIEINGEEISYSGISNFNADQLFFIFDAGENYLMALVSIYPNSFDNQRETITAILESIQR